MRIQAAIGRSGAVVDIETVELDAPGCGEVVVRLEACGICHTDLLALDGQLGTPLPAVLGHEGVGRIEDVGDLCDGFAAGDRVLMSFAACRTCPTCAGGLPAYCEEAYPLNFLGRRSHGPGPMSLDGAPLTSQFFGQSSFATYTVVAVRNLVKVPDDLPADVLAPFGCGLQTGLSSVLDLLDVQPGSSVAVFGCGTVGMAAIMGARLRGVARIVAVDLSADKLRVAASCGATDILQDAGKVQATSVDFALDCVGNVDVMWAAWRALRRRGQLLCLGVAPAGAELNLDPRDLVFSGRSIRGSIEGDADPQAFIPRMIDCYRDGHLPVGSIVTTYPFTAINKAIADLRSGAAIKPVLLM